MDPFKAHNVGVNLKGELYLCRVLLANVDLSIPAGHVDNVADIVNSSAVYEAGD